LLVHHQKQEVQTLDTKHGSVTTMPGYTTDESDKEDEGINDSRELATGSSKVWIRQGKPDKPSRGRDLDRTDDHHA
jgi:hypothetical protein